MNSEYLSDFEISKRWRRQKKRRVVYILRTLTQGVKLWLKSAAFSSACALLKEGEGGTLRGRFLKQSEAARCSNLSLLSLGSATLAGEPQENKRTEQWRAGRRKSGGPQVHHLPTPRERLPGTPPPPPPTRPETPAPEPGRSPAGRRAGRAADSLGRRSSRRRGGGRHTPGRPSRRWDAPVRGTGQTSERTPACLRFQRRAGVGVTP